MSNEFLTNGLALLETVGQALKEMADAAGMAFDSESYNTLLDRVRLGDLNAVYEIDAMLGRFMDEGEQIIKILES